MFLPHLILSTHIYVNVYIIYTLILFFFQLTIVAEALRGPQEIEVPVDTTLSGLHVKIDKLTRKAMLATPSGG